MAAIAGVLRLDGRTEAANDLHGVMAALGFLAGILTWVWLSRREKRPPGFVSVHGDSLRPVRLLQKRPDRWRKKGG